MNGTRQFHIDLEGHSITVNLGPGRSGSVELLVDGKVVGYVRERTERTTVVEGELADEPVRPFTVRIQQPALGLGRPPRCSVLIEGTELPMPQRRTPTVSAHRRTA